MQGSRMQGSRVLVGVRVGGALGIAEIEALARAGYRAIVQVGAEGEPGERLSPSVAASWAHTFGLRHGRIYVDGPPRSEHVERLRERLTELPRPLYLHSLRGRRAAALCAVLLAEERGLAGDAALSLAAASGLDPGDATLRSFVREELGRRARSDEHV